ncbi:hypothetical protein [Acinetobacter sp. ANC 3882]|uniref:hypothetical protein n=1 Tax=Acinetobacter sp. ANC 3882 TaxID=2923423 RepID=UPI001F4A8F59|nr:hypothetical protein [Acinetobacter sp. ANC 3882]MCH7314849.1 hypothetical protein [Acinetobacter sp. ANC 3882]
MEDSQNLSQPSSSHRVSIPLIVSYLLLTLPTSFLLGGLVSQLFTIMAPLFGNTKSDAWIGIFILSVPSILLACLVALPIIIKKAPRILSTVVWIFGCLTLFLVLYLTSVFN